MAALMLGVITVTGVEGHHTKTNACRHELVMMELHCHWQCLDIIRDVSKAIKYNCQLCGTRVTRTLNDAINDDDTSSGLLRGPPAVGSTVLVLFQQFKMKCCDALVLTQQH